MIEIFHEYLSDVYWEGMAEDLLQNDVKRYEWEDNDSVPDWFPTEDPSQDDEHK